MPLVLKNNTYSFFDNAGNFTSVYTGLYPEVQAGYGYVENVADTNMYIPDVGTPVATDKLANGISIDTTAITADGVDTATLSSIVNSSVASFTVPIDGVEAIPDAAITDGTLEFTATKPGDYIISIKLFPYLDYEVTVTAT